MRSGGPGVADGLGLAEVVVQVHPTVLIGTSTRAGAFTEAVIRDIAAHAERPGCMPGAARAAAMAVWSRRPPASRWLLRSGPAGTRRERGAGQHRRAS